MKTLKELSGAELAILALCVFLIVRQILQALRLAGVMA